MGAEAASARTNLVEPSASLVSPYGLARHTGYRVTVVLGAIEVTARLVEPNEVRNLMKVLQCGCIILEETSEGDMDKPLTLTRPAPKVGAVPSGKTSPR